MKKISVKTVLILTYIITILVISGIAKSAVLIDNYSIEKKLNMLSISGKVTDHCTPDLNVQFARPTFSEGEDLTDNFRNNHLSLVVINNNKSDECLNESSTILKFDLVVDIKELGVDTKSYSEVFVDGSNYSKFNLINSSEDLKSFDGLVVRMANGDFAVVNNNRSFYNLKSSIDLSKYSGEMVHISGFEYLNNFGPIFEIDSHDPLTEMKSKNGPEMFVMSISSLPLQSY